MKSASQKLVTLVTNYKKDPSLLDPTDDRDGEDDERRRPERAGRGGARRG